MKIRNYVKPESLEEAYALNQKKSARLIGGMMWLRTGRETIATAVDLSGLGLGEIVETKEEFRIGAMVTLRQLELHQGLADYTQGAMREALRSIVGVQFRNLATVGGSIWGRFGFSDVLTLFLALDTRVHLYKAGELPLDVFAKSGKDNDILTELVIKKRPQRTAYRAFRNTKTDFPVLTCAVSLPAGMPDASGKQTGWPEESGAASEEKPFFAGTVVVGARPGRAMSLAIPEKYGELLRGSVTSPKGAAEKGAADRRNTAVAGGFGVSADQAAAEIAEIAGDLGEQFPVGSNLRAGAEYRRHLAQVLIGRCLEQLCLEGEKGAVCRN